MEKDTIEKEINPLKIDVTKLITQTEYAKKMCISPQRVNQLVKAKEIKSITILGATLILLP